MDDLRQQQISAALHSCSVADFNEDFLKQISIQDLIFISKEYKEERANFRAAWALEHFLSKNPNLLITYHEQIITIYLKSSNWSTLRCISKLMIIILTTSSLANAIYKEESENSILEKSFQILTDMETPIAVRCNIYDILYAIGMQHHWLMRELKLQIQLDIERNSTPALLSRGNRILKKLKAV